MTISELLEVLEEMSEELGGETEVRFAGQPDWPFEYNISAVEVLPESDEVCEEEAVVYLVEGGQIGYLPEEVQEHIGW